MQQQQLSYAFQLQQNSICTSVEADPHKMHFYCSALQRNNRQQSLIHRLNYLQNAPRKSQVSTIKVAGPVQSIRALSFGQDVTQLFANINNNRICKLSQNLWDKNGSSVDSRQLQVFYQAEDDKINQINKTKDSIVYISLNKQIICIDINKENKKQSVLSVSPQVPIKNFCIEPTREFLTYTLNNQVIIYDCKQKKQKYSFKLCPDTNSSSITNINFNPNKQYYMMSGHHNCIKFWDIRKSNIPVKIVEDHHSLLLSAKYNHAHDQLLLECYDDGSIGLYRMSTVSSSPSGQAANDMLVKLYDDHQDSAYHVAWSHSTPWFFASASYNATNFVVNVVPDAEKFRILL